MNYWTELVKPTDLSNSARYTCHENLVQCLIRTRLTFPNHQNAPPLCFQSFDVPAVPFCCAAPLFFPELRPGFRRDHSPPAIVGVPEAAVNENYRSIFRQDNIRFSRQVFSVQPIPVTKRVKHRSNPHFRLGVPAPDRRHVATSLLGRVHIHDALTPEGATPARMKCSLSS